MTDASLSPTTATTACPNPLQCGSCDYANMPYQAQLAKKLLAINILLSESGIVCKNIIPSPKTSHYRNKMDYVIDFKRQVGLREKGKWWKVIDGHTCFLADEHIEDLFVKTRDWVKETPLSCWDRKLNVGFLRYVVARVTTLGETLLTIVTSPPEHADEENLALAEMQKLIELTGADTFVWSVNNTKSDVSYGTNLKTLKGLGYIVEDINGLKYRITPNAFFQTNSYTAKLLQDTVVTFAEKALLAGKKVLDLYCGSGFFSLALAKKGFSVTGIELVEEAIADAKENVRLNGLQNQTNLAVDFKAELAEKVSWLADTYDLVVVDPTRAGLHPKVLEALLAQGSDRQQPGAIIYVSCNYKQFAAELPKLLKSYTVADCVAIDQFPQTHHVELVTLLTLNS
jgi:23S rRNA (uracil-5-)-methyltransferase RumA